MTIDERIEKLVERHEALTEVVEILAREMKDLQGIVQGIAEGTARLLNTVEAHDVELDRHEVRISRLEQ